MIFWSINTFAGGKRSPKLNAELSDHRCIFDQNYQHIRDAPTSSNLTKQHCQSMKRQLCDRHVNLDHLFGHITSVLLLTNNAQEKRYCVFFLNTFGSIIKP